MHEDDDTVHQLDTVLRGSQVAETAAEYFVEDRPFIRLIVRSTGQVSLRVLDESATLLPENADYAVKRILMEKDVRVGVALWDVLRANSAVGAFNERLPELVDKAYGNSITPTLRTAIERWINKGEVPFRGPNVHGQSSFAMRLSNTGVERLRAIVATTQPTTSTFPAPAIHEGHSVLSQADAIEIAKAEVLKRGGTMYAFTGKAKFDDDSDEWLIEFENQKYPNAFASSFLVVVRTDGTARIIRPQ